MANEGSFQVVDSIPKTALNMGLVPARELEEFSEGKNTFGDRTININDGSVDVVSQFGIIQLRFRMGEGYSLAHNSNDANDKKLYVKYNNGVAILPMFLATYLRDLSKKDINNVQSQVVNIRDQIGDILGVQGY